MIGTEQALAVRPLRVLSLFSGIGGLDLGLERAGMEIVAHSEVDPYASRVLAKHWPDTPNLGDITAIDEWPDADVICGGFPCQDISLAGKGAGIEEGERSGLWREYARAIRAVRPRYVIVENVAALTSRGLDRVLRDLATLGYGAWWDCIPAASVGAPHLRDRVFIVATRADVAPFDTNTSPMQWAQEQRSEPHRNSTSSTANRHSGRQQERQERDGEQVEPGQPTPQRSNAHGLHRIVANSDSERGERGTTEPRARRRAQLAGGSPDVADAHRERLQKHRGGSESVGAEQHPIEHDGSPHQRRTPDNSLRRRHGGENEALRAGRESVEPASWWSVEPDVGRVASRIPRRVDRLRGLGNAVVPQVAQYIGELVVAHHLNNERAAA